MKTSSRRLCRYKVSRKAGPGQSLVLLRALLGILLGPDTELPMFKAAFNWPASRTRVDDCSSRVMYRRTDGFPVAAPP